MAYPELKYLQNKWDFETTSGNDLFQNKEHVLALEHYKRAHIVSEIMFKNVDDASMYNIPAIRQFSVSCKILANSFWVLNDIKKASDYFFYNIWCLKQLSKRSDLDEKLHFEANHEWSKGVLAITDFHHKIGQELTVDFWKDETYNTIKEAKDLLETRKTYLN